MTRRRRVLRSGAVAFGAALAGCPLGGGSDGPAATPGSDLVFESPAFESGATIPEKYTCEGEDVSPELTVGGVPDDAGSLAVVVDDPDAPGGTFVHWLLWNVRPDVETIPPGVYHGKYVADLDAARQGTNGFGVVGYRGPCPPPDDGAHTYRFKLFALDDTLDLAAGAEADALESAMEGRTVATGGFTGEFDR